MKDTYENVIDFIDAAIDSDVLMRWLANLEKMPDNLRGQHLANMKNQMVDNREPDRVIEIMESINKQQVLKAINSVIKDVHDSGLKTKKYLKKQDNTNFNLLISLMAST